MLHHRLQEVQDIPSRFSIAIKTQGSLAGEEDMIGKDYYTCTLKCYSTKGALFRLSRENLQTLKSYPQIWLQIIEGIVLKE